MDSIVVLHGIMAHGTAAINFELNTEVHMN
jgi:hypothetical protein